MGGWLKECLSSDGKVSSKRLITLLAFILFLIGYLSNLFFDFNVGEQFNTVLEYIIIVGIGATASEKFANRGNKKNENKKEVL
jgi:hypothetical protein